MYICKDCRRSFENCENWGDTTSFGEDIVPVDYPCCPFCYSLDIEEAEYCAMCTDEAAKSELEHGVCPKCVNEIVKNFYEFVSQNFCELERKIIKENIKVDMI
jgi:hypothetical protein